jgi:predicted N-acetyltransferase YhbS
MVTRAALAVAESVAVAGQSDESRIAGLLARDGIRATADELKAGVAVVGWKRRRAKFGAGALAAAKLRIAREAETRAALLRVALRRGWTEDEAARWVEAGCP